MGGVPSSSKRSLWQVKPSGFRAASSTSSAPSSFGVTEGQRMRRWASSTGSMTDLYRSARQLKEICMGRLEGKVAVVTGAASGIGRGTVDLFVAEGCKVIAADIQDDKGARIEEEHKGRARYVRCDGSVEKDIDGAVAAATKHFGRLAVLFNNAGTGGARDPADAVTAEGFDQVMHLHVRAALLGMKYAVPAMRAQGAGSIVSTASVAGLQA